MSMKESKQTLAPPTGRGGLPTFRDWKQFEEVEPYVDNEGRRIEGVLYARLKGAVEPLVLTRADLEPEKRRQALEKTTVKADMNGQYLDVVVPVEEFEKKLKSLKKAVTRGSKKGTNPGIWMTVEEAADRTPGSAEKARAWLWSQGLPRSLDGTRFVLTEEWIAALHSAPKAVRRNKGGE